MKKGLFFCFLAGSTIALWSFISQDAELQTQNTWIEPDTVFLKVAASSNLMEVELGNLAQQKATNQRVRDFGAMMVREHTRATQELMALPTTRTMRPPTTMLRQHSRHVDYLNTLSGAEFDRMYMRVMVEEHREDIDEFEDASKRAKATDVRDFASRMLPRLRMHLDTARMIRNMVRGYGSMVAGGDQTMPGTHGDPNAAQGGGTTTDTSRTGGTDTSRTGVNQGRITATTQQNRTMNQGAPGNKGKKGATKDANKKQGTNQNKTNNRKPGTTTNTSGGNNPQ